MAEPLVTITPSGKRIIRKVYASFSSKAAVRESRAMYADLEERKPSGLRNRLGAEGSASGSGVKLRLNGGGFGSGGAGSNQKLAGKRQRQDDDKWEHDLYSTQSSNPSGAPANDLRSLLSSKSSHGVKDLREKLSASSALRSGASAVPPPIKQRRVLAVTGANRVLSEVTKQGNLGTGTVVKVSAGGQKVSTKTRSVAEFLGGLGLAKYNAAFQVEEVDMAALKHMREDDLKEMGIPMGPRKKIVQALNP